jgi:hypothetical protein
MSPLGSRIWVIAEGYIPEGSTGPAPTMTSHETACILNAGDEDARVELTIYYADREPVGPYRVDVGARRTKHVLLNTPSGCRPPAADLRFNDLSDPASIPRGVDYSCVLRSNVPVVVQHTRLDPRQAANAPMTTMAHPVLA